MVVEGWLARAAATRPHRKAVQTPAGGWSYAELYAAAARGSTQLAVRGVGPGDRVAIALPPGLAFAQALHACLLLGAVAVPIDVRSPAPERAVLAAGATVLLEEPLVSAANRAGAATGAEEDARRGLEHDLDATAVVIHTSGTASSPRPIELSYGNLLWSALGSAVALGLDPQERWLCAMPVAHIGGLSILVRSAIYATTAVLHERFEVDRVLQALREQQITLVSLVATTLARLLDSGLTASPSLRCALTGGGPVPASLVRRARSAGVPVGLTYGLTEACSQVTTTPAAELADEGDGAGPPLFCTRVRIEEQAAAQPGTGEILLAGPTVARASRHGDGWLRTGDLGCLDERGRLHVSGRKADTIVSGGENVAPAEVEAVLEAHPDVLEAAVLPSADQRWGESVTAVVVVRPGRVLDGEALRAHCAVVLAPYKVPKLITLARTPLPRTRSGKLLRRELR
jgi:O-succinylbenzoic acid--CoA ligase